jgi:CP family cyanate transporter-like MFS transporter
VLAGLLLIALGTAARTAGGVALLFGATLIVGMGVGVVQTVVPAAVRERFVDRDLAVVGVLAASISGGAIAAAALSAPIADATGSWRLALAVWALPAVAAVPLWLAAGGQPAAPHAWVQPVERRTAVMRLGAIVGGVSFAYFVLFAWLVPVLVEAGLSTGAAGLVLAASSAPQIPAALLTGSLVRRVGGFAPALAQSLAVTAFGMAGIALVRSELAIAFALLAGIGLGVLFALSLMLPVQLAGSADEAVWLAGRAFGIGYLLASAGPLIAGLGRDLTGSLAPGFAITATLLLMTTLLARGLAARPEMGATP